jgi:hypothetical protein
VFPLELNTQLPLAQVVLAALEVRQMLDPTEQILHFLQLHQMAEVPVV